MYKLCVRDISDSEIYLYLLLKDNGKLVGMQAKTACNLNGRDELI